MPKYKRVKYGQNTGRGYELVEFTHGGKNYHLNGLPHREDGPAIIYFDGSKLWYLNGKELSKEDFTSIEMVKCMQAYSLFTVKELARMKLDKQDNS
jgi:hypothetical protein